MADFVGVAPDFPSNVQGTVGSLGFLAGEAAVVSVSVPDVFVTDYDPPAGSTIASDSTMAFTVLAAAIAQLVIITYEFAGTDQPEVAFDGTRFVGRYSASVRESVTGGFRYVMQRAGGWPSGSIEPKVIGVDSTGHVRYL